MTGVTTRHTAHTRGNSMTNTTLSRPIGPLAHPLVGSCCVAIAHVATPSLLMGAEARREGAGATAATKAVHPEHLARSRNSPRPSEVQLVVAPRGTIACAAGASV